MARHRTTNPGPRPPGPTVKRMAATHHAELQPPWQTQLAVNVRQAAQALGLGHDAMYRLINSAEIRSVKVGSRRLVPTAELHRLLGDGLEPSV